MDKRQLSEIFQTRLRSLVNDKHQNTAQFLAATGIDRSALSQFLDPAHVRLPRAETLRNIATACGVSVDWLLGLENAPEGRQSLSSRVQIEHMAGATRTPLEQWRAEVEGQKIRYVPSLLPDMLNLAFHNSDAVGETEIRGSTFENILGGAMPEDLDFEICMPIQTLHNLAEQSGYWKGASPELCRRQLNHMAQVCDEMYPTLRLHVYDGNQSYASSFTVFGKTRVAIYVGEAYLVLTAKDEIQAFVRKFDGLVRKSLFSPDRVGAHLRAMAKSTA